MQKAREPAAPAAAPPRTLDGFVLAAVTIVALALGLALYFHLGLGAGAVLICVVAAHVAMSCAHLAIRRGQRIRELSADVERLRQGGGLAPPARTRRAQQPAPRQGPSSRPAAGPLTVAVPEPAPQAEAARAPVPAVPDRRAMGASPAPQAVATVPPQPPPHDASRRAEGYMPPEPQAAVAAGPMAPSAVGVHDLEAAPGRSAASIAEMWTLRPGTAREPSMGAGPLLTALPEEIATVPLHGPATGSRSNGGPAPIDWTGPLAEPGPAPRVHYAEATETAAAPPPAEHQPSPAGPTTSPDEFSTIQALIKRLADDLSSPRKPEPPELSGAAAEGTRAASPQDDMITRSVEALRETADMMRNGAPAALRTAERAPAPPREHDRLAIEAPAPPPLPEQPSQDPAPGLGGTIVAAVNEERFAVYVEPIHGLPDGKARHFEVSVRLDLGSGREVDPRELGPEHCDRALLTRIDGAKFLRTARFAERLLLKGKRASVHSTIAAASLAEDTFVDGVADNIGANERLATHLVLSFTQGDVRTFSPVHWEALRTLAAIGVRFALEEVVDVDMDLEALKAEGFDFVKLDAAVLTGGLPAGASVVPPPDLCRYMAQIGMSIVVGGIDDEVGLARIMGFGVVLGKGALFGGPRQVRVDLAGEAQMAAA